MNWTQRQLTTAVSTTVTFFLMLQFLPIVFCEKSKTEPVMKTRSCSVSLQELNPLEFRGLPLIIVITPTRRTLTRLADMTRLAQTLMLVRNLAWIVVEDGDIIADPIERLLKRSMLPFCYFVKETNDVHIEDWRWVGRDSGLRFVVRRFANFFEPAVVYFADEDGAYDIRLFDSYVRNVNSIGVWALGLADADCVIAPKVSQGGIVEGWLGSKHAYLEWPLDAPGFAISLKLLLEHDNISLANCVLFPAQECLLSQLGVTKKDAQPFGHNIEPRDLLAWQPITNFTLNNPTIPYSTYGYVVEYDPPEQTRRSNSMKRTKTGGQEATKRAAQ